MTVRPPTLREKKRYILVRVLPGGTKPDPKDLYYAVFEAVTSLWGDHAGALVQPAVVAVEDGFAVVRCRRGTEQELATALPTVISCRGQHIALRAVATSGTIESLRERIGDHREAVTRKAAGGECMFDQRSWSVVHCDGHKVDVIEKGFKNAARFYLTTEDLEVI